MVGGEIMGMEGRYEMTSTSHEKDRIRVTITHRDFGKWVPEDTPQSLVKHWIEIGRRAHTSEIKASERHEAIEKRLDKIEEKLDDLSESCLKLTDLELKNSRLLSLISTALHYDIEVLKRRAESEELAHDDRNRYALFRIKEANFNSYVKRNFPLHDTESFVALSTLEREDA